MNFLEFDIKKNSLRNCNIALWERFLVSFSCNGIKNLTFFHSNFFPDPLRWQVSLDGREPSLEVDIWLKTIIIGRQNLMENNLLQRTTFNRRQPYIKEKHQQKNFNDRQLKLITAQFDFTPITKSDCQKRIRKKVGAGNLGLNFLFMLEKNQHIWFDNS